jgi:hypothetical protein
MRQFGEFQMGWTKPRRKPRHCEEPGCDQFAQARGLCSLHYRHFYVRWKKACLENVSLTKTEESVLPERPKWFWHGNEQSLIDVDEARTRANTAAVSGEKQ